MNFSRFPFQTGYRVALIVAAAIGFAFSLSLQYPPVVIALLGLMVVVMVISLIRYVNRTNQEITSFLTGLRYGDFQQSFTVGQLGKTFRDLESVLTLTMDKMKSLRAEKEQQAAYFQALIEHIPLPLFVVHGKGRIEVLNNATRRAFDVADLTNTRDLADFGAAFQRDVKQIEPGESLLTSITVDTLEQQYILSATQITLAGRIHKLISLQNVQSEIDATELATWQNLLRITSHEIMNSLTPVSSLARTAKTLVDDMPAPKKGRQDIDDLKDALDTLLKRSEGLTRFIQSYRQLTRMPPPKAQKIEIKPYFARLESLISDELKKKNVKISLAVEPASLVLEADEDMLDQALINLVKNAADAVTGKRGAKITVSAFIDPKQRVAIDVADNGPGIDKDTAEKIFVPFFTTKKQGSGVGLALVRYIMLSHGGTVILVPGRKKGATFRLVF